MAWTISWTQISTQVIGGETGFLSSIVIETTYEPAPLGRSWFIFDAMS